MREIDIVIPVYNEVLVLENLKKELDPIISKSEEFKFKLLFIDDGSTDGTLIKLIEWQEKNQQAPASPQCMGGSKKDAH